MRKPIILDLFCKAGGAAMGLYRAGFKVIGVDIIAQPHYPFEFHQGDALTFPLDNFDAYWASPPCQKYSTMTAKWGRQNMHPDLISPIRERLIKTGKPYIIENVPGAPLNNPITLCGSMFGLPLRRHRIFEMSNPPLLIPPCNHTGKVIGVYGHAGGSSKRDGLTFAGTDAWREAMQIDWMVGNELAEAIPPAYSQFLGEHLLRYWFALC